MSKRIPTSGRYQIIGFIAAGYLIGKASESFIAGVMPIVNGLLVEVVKGVTLGKEYWMNTVVVSVVSNTVLAGLLLFAAYAVGQRLRRKPS